MARGQLIVEPSRLDAVAAKVEGYADDYKTTYEALYSAAQDLQGKWKGEDSAKFVERINGFRDDFQRMEKLMREYADYLRKSAEAIRETERSGVQRANQLSIGS